MLTAPGAVAAHGGGLRSPLRLKSITGLGRGSPWRLARGDAWISLARRLQQHLLRSVLSPPVVRLVPLAPVLTDRCVMVSMIARKNAWLPLAGKTTTRVHKCQDKQLNDKQLSTRASCREYGMYHATRWPIERTGRRHRPVDKGQPPIKRHRQTSTTQLTRKQNNTREPMPNRRAAVGQVREMICSSGDSPDLLRTANTPPASRSPPRRSPAIQ